MKQILRIAAAGMVIFCLIASCGIKSPPKPPEQEKIKEEK